MNIISYGANDLYLTGAPQITHFKIIYRRYTNFSKESVILPINNMDFNSEMDIELPHVGDLLNELYVQIELPEVSFLRSDIDITPDTTHTSTAQDNYNKITKFMKMNTSAYRIAYNDAQVSNLTANVLVADVLTAFETAPDDILAYRSLLTLTNASLKYAYLDPDQSDISAIINIIANALETSSTSWTTSQILSRLEMAIQTSIKVQEYFYDKLLQYNATYDENSSSYALFAWVSKLGHSIIDTVEFKIGGEIIDSHVGTWLDIWHELSGKKHQEKTYDKMIGNVSILTKYDNTPKPKYLMQIPLSFWFCRHTGLSLPLIALNYTQASLTIKFKKIEDCAYIEKNVDATISLTDLWYDKGYSLKCAILADYVYLDTLERKRFAQSAHEYLIEKVQTIEFDNVNDTKLSINLDFRSPCKELFWVAQKNAYINNDTNYYKSMWCNYGVKADGTGNCIASSMITFNGYTRMAKSLGNYTNYVLPYAHHTNTPSDGINIHSFALFPEEYQPTGSCNFSRISLATLDLQFNPRALYYKSSDIDPSIVPPAETNQSPYPLVWKYSTIGSDTYTSDNSTTLKVYVFAVSHNIFRVIGGYGALAYY